MSMDFYPIYEYGLMMKEEELIEALGCTEEEVGEKAESIGFDNCGDFNGRFLYFEREIEQDEDLTDEIFYLFPTQRPLSLFNKAYEDIDEVATEISESVGFEHEFVKNRIGLLIGVSYG